MKSPGKRVYIQKTETGVELRPAVIDPITETNLTYYYVWYSFRKSSNDYIITTTERIFGEKKIMYRSSDKEEIIRVADAINATIRLLSGYPVGSIKAGEK